MTLNCQRQPSAKIDINDDMDVTCTETLSSLPQTFSVVKCIDEQTLLRPALWRSAGSLGGSQAWISETYVHVQRGL